MATFLYLMLLLIALQTPATNGASDNALLDAAQSGDLRGVTKALGQGANVNAKNRYSSTPLILAALGGHVDIVKLLVDRGADLKASETFYQIDALGAAMMNGHVDVIRYFMERGIADASGVLQAAVQRRNASLLGAALSSKDLPERIVAAAHSWATRQGTAEMVAAAEAAMKARGRRRSVRRQGRPGVRATGKARHEGHHHGHARDFERSDRDSDDKARVRNRTKIISKFAFGPQDRQHMSAALLTGQLV